MTYNNSSACSCIDCQDKPTVYLRLANQQESRSYCMICASHLKHHGSVEDEGHDLNKEVPGDHRISVKEYPCKNGCGTMIRFDNNKVSESKKKIPLSPDGTPHICSKAPKIPCKFCACEISFERTTNGKWIAHNPDGSFHECPAWPPGNMPVNKEGLGGNVIFIDTEKGGCVNHLGSEFIALPFLASFFILFFLYPLSL